MGKKSEAYTVMILPSPTASPYRFSFSKKTLYCLFTASSLLTLVLVGFLIQHFVLIKQVWELDSLREETRIQKTKIQGFLTTVSDLKKQMLRLRELETKMRVITDIPSEKEQQASLQLNGMGGPGEPNSGSEGTFLVSDEPIEVSEVNIKQLSKGIERDLTHLVSLATQKEVSFQEITSVMQGKQALWASTPSIWPVNGWVTSGFGKRISPFTGKLSNHKGIDIAARPKTPIIAPANGVIVRAGFKGRFGKMIKIDHGYGMVTRYGHLSKVTVRVGQKVKRGELVGYVGSTGRSTGPHLHYEVFVKNRAVNPLGYILN